MMSNHSEDYQGYSKYRELMARTCKMVRTFLIEEIYHDEDVDATAEEWGVSPRCAEFLLTGDRLIPVDLLAILDHTGLDFGVVVRCPASGREVTFFAADNLAGEDEGTEQRTEEVVHYDPKPKGGKGLDGIEVVHEVVQIVDGNFDVDEPDEFDEVLPRDVKDLDAWCDRCEEGLALEGTTRCIHCTDDSQEIPVDLDNLCEYCLDQERETDSMLCHGCADAGIECAPPDHLEPEHCLEVLASIDRQAEHAQSYTQRLLAESHRLMGMSARSAEGE